VKVEANTGSGNVPRTENQYNGLNWRTVHRADTNLSGDLDEQRIMQYNASWQLVEEDIYEGWSIGSPGSVDERRAYFWGNRYIDDLIQTLVDGYLGASPDGGYEDVSGGNDAWFFHLTDAQFSTVQILDRSGNLVERVTYDAYGQARHHDDKDVDGDGDFDSTDRGILTTLVPNPFASVAITSGSYNADCDLNRDGVLNITDLGLMGTSYVSALAKGELSNAQVRNAFGYDGYRFNAETQQYKVRHRDYDTVMGRWLQRDPLEYADGPHLYTYIKAVPTNSSDSFGLLTSTTHNAFIVGKSYIAIVGNRHGFVLPPPPAGPDPLFAIKLLIAMKGIGLATATDIVFGESPTTSAKDLEYRLYSRLDLTFDCCADGSVRLRRWRTDREAGWEGPVQGSIRGFPSLDVAYLTQTKTAPSGYEVSFADGLAFVFGSQGNPNVGIEPGFQMILPRTSVTIYHVISGYIRCGTSGSEPEVYAQFTSTSDFPSHRLWHNRVAPPNETRPQGFLRALWYSDSTLGPAYVRGTAHLWRGTLQLPSPSAQWLSLSSSGP